MGDAAKTICPPTLWAQTKDRILLSFNVQDTKGVEMKFEERSITFTCTGGIAKQAYKADLQLLKDIDPEASKWDKTSRLITVVVVKKEAGPFWPRLLETKAKQHWLKVDFDKMKDSDESSEDEMPANVGQPDLSQMMAQMGRGTGAADFGDLGDEDDDEDDSDDDEIPGLETADDTPNGAPETPGAEAEGQACNA